MRSSIIDVHTLSTDGLPQNDISKQVAEGLSRPAGHKQIPTMLLYDERGLRLYDEITTEAPEYYLFGAEEEILKNKADDIVQIMHRGAINVPADEVVIELGAGALRKTSHILRSLSHFVERADSANPITYYALDLEKRELSRCLETIEKSDIGTCLEGKVETKGMCGTYDDGLRFIERGGLQRFKNGNSSPTIWDGHEIPAQGVVREASPFSTDSSSGSEVESEDVTSSSTSDDSQPPLHILFLGSSLGNFSRDEAPAFLRSLPLRPGAGDTLLLGLDHDNDKNQIEVAYNDKKGYTKKFIMNGLRAAGRTLGNESMFIEDNWDYVNVYNTVERRHEAYFKSKCKQSVQDPSTQKEISFLENELMKIEESYKFSETDAYSLFSDANLRPIERWTDSAGQYSLWLLERPPFQFPILRSNSLESIDTYSTSPFGVPSRREWKDLWAAWDVITIGMIPPSMLHQKPIDLRHICLFYLGHIPTFLDIHLSRLLGESHTEPGEYKYIFERGIDPNVDDPTVCHPHSEVPQNDEEWPAVSEILHFQKRVRDRLMRLYDDIDTGKLELTRKVGRVLFMTLEHEAMHAETLLYMLLQRAGTGTLPPPNFTAPNWESLSAIWNCSPAPAVRVVELGPAVIKLGHEDNEDEDFIASDVRQHELGWDNENPIREVHVSEFVIEWRPVTNGDFHSFYVGGGKEKVKFPASWIEQDGKIQVRTLYGPVPIDIAVHWPVIVDYNSLSAYATVKGGRLPTEPELRLFYEKFNAGYVGGANIGFRNWHPVPATTGGSRDGGRGTNGGVWEWTSTILEKVDGFSPSKLYPGYSADFFDGKHQIVLGGSYATIPRIAERKSFRNWYQRNYPYAWVGGRIAYDVPKHA
ncbi:hypothetical protein BDQ17DRAFT_1231986 [Cyathus striatus]|nr:hypothetical protein BDQ17DRAFT_1231986 [Cyathus striatus]